MCKLRYSILIFLALFIFGLRDGGGFLAHAASFNCAKASTVIEKAICNNQELSQLDEQVAMLYKRGQSRGGDASQLKKAQQSWIKNIRNSCETISCLRYAYLLRIGQLGTGFVEDDNAGDESLDISKVEPIANGISLEVCDGSGSHCGTLELLSGSPAFAFYQQNMESFKAGASLNAVYANGEIISIASIETLSHAPHADAAATNAEAPSNAGPRYTPTYMSCMDASGGVTVAMHDCMSSEIERQTKRMDVAVQKQMTSLSPERQKLLQETQKAWQAYVKINVDLLHDPEGGTIAGVNAGGWYLEAITLRAEFLEEME